MAHGTGSKQAPFDRLDWLVAGGIFIAAMLLYVRTLATTLLLGDSGEFQTLAATLGLAHGTGYPIYIILTRIFSLLVPIRDIAYRVNLFSAVCAALTLAQLTLINRALGGWRVAGLVGAAALGVNWLFWWHSVIAEVYTPAAAVITLVLLLLILWRKSGDPRLLFWAGLAGGLGLGVHYEVLLVAPAAVLYLGLSAPHGSRRSAWLRAIAGALIAVAIYFITFFALDLLNAPSTNFKAVMQPSLSALDITPEQAASPLGRIRYLASGRQFQGQLGGLSPQRVTENRLVYYDQVRESFHIVFLGLAGLGLLALLFSRRWPVALLLVFAWLGMFIYITNYDISDIVVFYIPSYVPLAVMASAGASAVLDGLSWLLRKVGPAFQRPGQWASGLVGLIFVALMLALSAPDVQAAWEAKRILFLDQTDYRYYPYPVLSPGTPHMQAKAIASTVEDNAIIFTDWGMVYPIYYVAHVEQGRTGISVHETYPAMTPKPFAGEDYIHANFGRRPIYFTSIVGELTQEFRFVGVAGLELYRLEKK